MCVITCIIHMFYTSNASNVSIASNAIIASIASNCLLYSHDFMQAMRVITHIIWSICDIHII